MMNPVTMKEMRLIDDKAEKHFGIELPQMLENAGRNAAFFTREAIGKISKKNVCIICGNGNKGAAGLVAARFLHNWGAKVTVIMASHPDELKKWTRWYAGTLKSIYVDALYTTNHFAFGDIMRKTDIIVDALLGYNISRSPEGFYKTLIEMANSSEKKILSIDTPSGMDPNTGDILGTCIKARWTMMITAPKKGLLEKKARDYTGTLYLCDIGVPPEVFELLGIKYDSPFAKNEIVKM